MGPKPQGVRIGRRDAECWVLLRHATDPFHDGYDFVDFVAEVHGPGLDAASPVRSAEGALGLVTFVRSLAIDWRGWEGVRRWEAIEHQLAIDAEHDPLGHVNLRVTLRGSWKPDAWEATVEVQVEAGEELGQLADEVGTFVT
ncbi:MAG: DUF6228 family protein, partial [Actinobacteria bacterium]|nr:DUF6228 family protein [Actinomycetota bacterium]